MDSEVSAKPAIRRRRLDAADAREAILSAAEALLVEAGPDVLRLTEVATRAGVSHPNVLYHFGSVAELQSKLAQRVAIRLADEMAQIFAQGLSGTMPLAEAIAAVFRVFDEGGFGRLLAWLQLSNNEPTFDALASKLDLLRSVMVSHPMLRGAENESRRRRVIPIIELVVFSAIGYGLMGKTVDAFFSEADHGPTVARLLVELISIGEGFPLPPERPTRAKHRTPS